MSFDPSALQDVGTQPDIGGAIAKGFQLKDLVDQNQLNTLKLTAAKSQANDDNTAKKILSGSDLTSDKGLAEASEKLTKAGMPQKAMELRKYGQDVQSGDLDNKLKQLQVHEKSLDFGISLLDPIVATADQMRYAGKSNAMIDAYIQAQIPLVVQQINDSDLPPDLKQQALKKAQSEQKMTYDQLKSAESQSKQGRDMIAARLNEFKADTAAKGEKEKERHDEKMEEQGQKRIDNTGGFTPDHAALLASFASKGVALPTGMRSKAQQIATLNGLLAKYPDKSPDEIAEGVKNGQISMGVAKTEGSVLGRREAAILPVEKSITRQGGFLDQAEKAVDSVDFPKLKAAGQFSQWGKEQESDPALSRYKAAVAELRAEYSIVLSKGGQVTDAARHEAEKVIPDLITKDQFKAIKQVVLQGIESSKGGIEESISGVTGKDASTGSAPKNNDPLGIR